MKFIKTKFLVFGLALTTCLNVAASDRSVNIRLSDTTPVERAQDLVSYLSDYKDELSSQLPDGHSIDITITNIVIPGDVDKIPKHKTTVSPVVSDDVGQTFSTGSRNLDIPGGRLSRPHRLQFEYAVVDAEGNKVAQGKKNLKLNSTKAVDRTEQPYIEQRIMLTNWMKRAF